MSTAVEMVQQYIKCLAQLHIYEPNSLFSETSWEAPKDSKCGHLRAGEALFHGKSTVSA